MLAKTQLRSAKTTELERLQARIAAELASRHQQQAVSQKETSNLLTEECGVNFLEC